MAQKSRSEAESREDLALEERVLELLLAHNLFALLATAHEIWHYLLGRSKRQILEDLEATAPNL